MTRRESIPARGWRSPVNPARVLQERRPALVADGKRAPIAVARMSTPDRDRFFAQLAAFRAGCALVVASTANAAYGVPVPHDVVVAWQTTRDELEVQVGDWRQRRDYRQHMIRETGGGLQ